MKDNPEAAYLDEYEYLGELLRYNGIPTIQAKTRLALEQGSGVMFWTIDHDDKGDYSLIRAIQQEIQRWDK